MQPIWQTTFREHEAESVGQVPERYPFLVCHPSVGYVGHDLTEAVAQSVYRAMRSTPGKQLKNISGWTDIGELIIIASRKIFA